MKLLKCRAAIIVITAPFFLHSVFASSPQRRPAHTRSSAATQTSVVVNPLDEGFATVIGRTIKAVVNIASTELEPGDDPGDQRDGRQGRARCLGSGVIVGSDGYILTSNHVVANVTDIRVLLSDNRELTAQIVGLDPKTDIAVLKVNATDLPILVPADPSSLHVGDLALAISDPFGLRQTVTMGIISATGRSGLGILPYENFIQTDAAINPGSSGGALINVHGELLGIITAGLKQYGGVGFVVPIDLVS